MRTLLHHDGALGDVLLSLPCFDVIRRDASSLHFIGRLDIAAFLEQSGLAEAASSSDQAGFASLYSNLDAQMRRFLGPFDRAYVFSALPDSPAAAGISGVIADTRTIRTIPPQGMGISAARYRFAQLCPGTDMPEERVIQATRKGWDTVSSIIGESGWNGGRPLVALHPGSGGREKCWPLERYLDLAERLVQGLGAFLVLFSGPAEEGEVQQRIDRFAFSRGSVLHAARWRLDRSTALLSRASLYIGNDSGFTHLAAAAGSPIIALFGPTDPVIWKPVGSRVTVLRSPLQTPIAAIVPDTVYDRVLDVLRPSGTDIGPKSL